MSEGVPSMSVGQAGADTPHEAIGKMWEKRISNMPRHKDYACGPKRGKKMKRKRMKMSMEDDE